MNQDIDNIIKNIPHHFTQSYFYGSWQETMGRSVKRFLVENDQGKLIWQAIRYPLPLKKCYWYVPHGPIVVGKANNDLLASFEQENKKLLKDSNGVFMRLDPYPPTQNEIWAVNFKKVPIHSYFAAYFQIKFDWRLSLKPSLEEIYEQMDKKNRYGIRVSQNKEVTIEKVSGREMKKYFEDFYRLMVETSARGEFGLHPKKYYQVIFDSAENNPHLMLLIAKYKDEVLATHLIIFYSDTAFYPFGASTAKERDRMPTYAIHWETIKEAKERGCHWYNLGGVDVDPRLAHKNWGGINRFKRRFGGEILEYSDFYDVVGQPFLYWLYNLRKKIRH